MKDETCILFKISLFFEGVVSITLPSCLRVSGLDVLFLVAAGKVCCVDSSRCFSGGAADSKKDLMLLK